MKRGEILHHVLFGSLLAFAEFDSALDVKGWDDHERRKWDCAILRGERSATFHGATVQGTLFEDLLEAWEFQYPGLRVDTQSRKLDAGFFCHTMPPEISVLVRAGVWSAYAAGGGSRKYVRGFLAKHLAGIEVSYFVFVFHYKI